MCDKCSNKLQLQNSGHYYDNPDSIDILATEDRSYDGTLNRTSLNLFCNEMHCSNQIEIDI